MSTWPVGAPRRPGGPEIEDQSNLKTDPDTPLVGERFRLIVDGRGTLDLVLARLPGAPSTTPFHRPRSAERASTIAEIRTPGIADFMVAGPIDTAKAMFPNHR